MMEPKDLTHLVGVIVIVVNITSAFSIVTQIRLTYRRKDTVGLSRVAWIMAASNALVGTLYSVLINDLVFTLANLAWLIVNGTMVILLLRYRRTAKTDNVSGVGLE
jgi:uncharacterized protein with PQ loop repeat